MEVPQGEIKIEWKLLNAKKQIDVTYFYQKESCLEKEAVYIAFPFNIQKAKVLYDSQLGWINWDEDELPGACKEWLPLQTSMLLESEDTHIQIASPDIPLFCINEMVQGKWPKGLDLKGNKIYSYVLNNYWNTNYKASQGGYIEFRYSLTSAASISKDKAYRFGWEHRQPLYGHRINSSKFRWCCINDNEKTENDGDAWIVRLQEIKGGTQKLTLSVPGKMIGRASRTDLLETELEPLSVEGGNVTLTLSPWSLYACQKEVPSNKPLTYQNPVFDPF